MSMHSLWLRMILQANWAAYADRLAARERANELSWSDWGQSILTWRGYLDPVYFATGRRHG